MGTSQRTILSTIQSTNPTLKFGDEGSFGHQVKP